MVHTQNLLIHLYWTICNNIITSWILNSVMVKIRNNIVYIQSTREIWLDLEVRYVVSNVPKLFHLRKKLHILHKVHFLSRLILLNSGQFMMN